MSQYEVITSGRVREGFTREGVVAGFCKAFKCDAVTAEKVLCGRPRALKKGLEQEKAEKYLALVESLGIDAWLGGPAESSPVVSTLR